MFWNLEAFTRPGKNRIEESCALSCNNSTGIHFTFIPRPTDTDTHLAHDITALNSRALPASACSLRLGYLQGQQNTHEELGILHRIGVRILLLLLLLHLASLSHHHHWIQGETRKWRQESYEASLFPLENGAARESETSSHLAPDSSHFFWPGKIGEFLFRRFLVF